LIDVQFTPSTRVLRGLDEIAAYLKVHRRTVQRWIHTHAFVAILGPSDAYMTTTSLVDLWIITVWDIEQKARKGEGSVGGC
jgi:hypothetical protein